MRHVLNRRSFLTAMGVGSLTFLFPRRLAYAKEKRPVAGALLLARIETPPFRDSVVLLYEHGGMGSAGLIINKPEHLSLGDIMVRMEAPFRDRPTHQRYARSEVLYGGPVERGRLLSLIHAPPGRWARSWKLGTVAVTQDTSLLRELAAATAGVKQVVACLGYSGWAAGQLESEIAAGHWQVAYPDPAALPGLLFDTPPCNRLEKARQLPQGVPVGIPGRAI
ncbi:MAG: YqgE/AlgH family protein [Candidatus Methylomirabilales bacterium]